MKRTNLERTQQTLIHTHHGTCIIKLAAVIRSAEQGHKLSFAKELVAVLHNLMCATDQIHVVLLEESRHNIRAESERHSTIIFAPTCNILVGIRPEEVTQKAAVRNLPGLASISRPEAR